MAHCLSVTKANGLATAAVVALVGSTLVGCQSHLNSQLLERELRLQEDQIYRLQDVLDEKCARLEYVVQENASLKRQLGYGDAAPVRGRAGGTASGRSSSSGSSSAPAFAPPTIELSDPAPPSVLPPPTSPPAPAGLPVLEGVPPLPSGPVDGADGDTPGDDGGDAPPAFGLMPEVTVPALEPEAIPEVGSDPLNDGFDDGPSFAPTFVAPQASAPGLLDETAQQASAIQDDFRRPTGGFIQPLSYQQEMAASIDGEASSLAPLPVEAVLERIVINRSETRAVDTNTDGIPDALSVVFEPRDLDERLIAASGDVVITVHPASVHESSAALASWTIPAADAASTFRSTSRSRGLRFLLPWQQAPQKFAGVVHVELRAAEGVARAETPISIP